MRTKYLVRLLLSTLACLAALGEIGLATAQPAAPPGLVLWNKLGSQTEVLNSEFGADFAISSQPEVQFFPGEYGGSFGTEGGIWGYGGYLYMSPDEFFAPDKTRGTVEAWLQKRIPSVIGYVTAHVGIFGIQQYNCVPWVNPCDRDDYVPISARWDGVDGMLGGGLVFTLVDAGGVWHDARDTGWNEISIVPLYEWHHVAFVWDLTGIAGTADIMRVYRDGVLVAANTDTIDDLMVDPGYVKLLGNHEYRRTNQPLAYMDNIKVWDYAKTDFSDRFIEGFGLPPVAEANGPYTVAEGSSVPLDGTASYDPDPGDVLTYAWDLDGDGVYGETGAGALRGDETGATPTFSAAGLDGPASTTINLRVADRYGLTDSDTATVEVANALPVVNAGPDQDAYVHVAVSLAPALFSDAGTLDTHTATIDWGDGAVEPGAITASGGSGAVAGSHTYLAAGTYSVTVTVTDDDGGGGADTMAVTVFGFSGAITQTPSTTPVVRGTHVDVRFRATNTGRPVDAFIVLPLDTEEAYVAGSVYGGAMPLTAARLRELAGGRGLRELTVGTASAAAGDVVAIAYMGAVATGEMLDFGFKSMVTSMTGSIQHSAVVFDGSQFIQGMHSGSLEIVDNSAYPVYRSRRFDVDRDSFLDGSQPNAFYGSSQTMWVGYYDQMRPVVHMPLGAIPGDAYVDVAYLYLYVYEGRGFSNWSGSVINVKVHPITSAWMSEAANWVTPWANPGGDFGTAVGINHLGSGKIGAWLRLDVTSAVEMMVRSGVNHGFILTSDDSRGVRYGFATKENWMGKVDYLRVMYRTAN